MDPLPALREFVSAGKLKEVELQSDGFYRQEEPLTVTKCNADNSLLLQMQEALC